MGGQPRRRGERAYRSSELFALTAVWPAGCPVERRCVGGGRLVSEELEARVVDAETGRPCEPGVRGELQFRGYNVLDRYLGSPEAAADAFTADGWLRSGDLGERLEDEREFVYVCRAGDALRLRGFLVEPAEIERFLSSHPDVETAKVVGVRAEAGGDVAVAYVTALTGRHLDGDDLRSFARERLAPYKVPAFINVVEEFPVTTGTNGTKIRTAEMRRWAADQLAAAETRGAR